MNEELYVVVPTAGECLGPFDDPINADNRADEYFAGQVSYEVRPLLDLVALENRADMEAERRRDHPHRGRQ